MLPNEKAASDSGKRVRIRLYQEHLGYIDQIFLDVFQETCQVPRINPWIRKKVQDEFQLVLKGKTDLKQWQHLLAERFYENPVEWIKEMMRREMYPPKSHHLIDLAKENEGWF